jgi:Tfp pilus assembly protein PilF
MDKAYQEWYGKQHQPERRFDKYFAPILDAARRGDPEAEKGLVRVAGDARLPTVVRATALLELGQFDSRQTTGAILDLLADPHPEIRATAIGNLQGRLDEQRLAQTLAPLLGDPLRLVRIEAARVLSGVPDGLLRGSQRQQLRGALAELERGLVINNDRAGSHVMRAILAENQDQHERAIQAYQDALYVEPGTSGPRTNLAALYDRLVEMQQRRAAQAAARGDAAAGDQATAEANRLRQEAARLRQDELELFARDARLAPDAAFVQYRYGMLLYLHGRFDEAEQSLRRAADLEPNNPQLLLGVTLFYKERNQPELALRFAEQLVRLRPQDAMYRQVWEEIRALPRSPSTSP